MSGLSPERTFFSGLSPERVLFWPVAGNALFSALSPERKTLHALYKVGRGDWPGVGRNKNKQSSCGLCHRIA